MKIKSFIRAYQDQMLQQIDLKKLCSIFKSFVEDNCLLVYSDEGQFITKSDCCFSINCEALNLSNTISSLDKAYSYILLEDGFDKRKYSVLCICKSQESLDKHKESIQHIIKSEFKALSLQEKVNYLEAKSEQDNHLIDSIQKQSKVISKQNSEYQFSLETHFMQLEDTIQNRTFDLKNQLKIIQFKNKLLQLISDASSERADFFNQCCPLVSKFMDVGRTSIWVHDNRLKELSIIYGDGLNQSQNITVKDNVGFVGKCFKGKKTFLINNPYMDEVFFTSIDKKTGYTTENVLVTPIMKDNTVLGVLQLLNKEGGFDKKDLDLAQRIASTMINHLKVYELIALERAAKYELEALLSTIPDVVYKVSKDGKFEYVSKSIEKWGYSTLDLIGKHYSMLFKEPKPNNVSRQNVLESYRKNPELIPKSPPKLFDERRSDDRSTKELEIIIEPGKDHKDKLRDILGEVSASGYWVSNERTLQKEFKGTIGIIRDISVRKSTEQTLEKTRMTLLQAERFASLGTLAAGIAHDFNNLLGIVLMGIELQNSKDIVLTPERIKSTNDKIIDAITKATSLTQRLLTIARSNEPKVENCSLQDVIDEVLDLMDTRLSSNGIKFVYNNNLNVDQCMIDKGQFNDVLINIITNSIHAIEELEINQIREIGIDLTETTGFFNIMIWDTGVGIEQKIRNQIYDPFFTTKDRASQKGTGLGLAMVYAFIENHLGEISVESFTKDEGYTHAFQGAAISGTIFNLSIPKSDILENDKVEVKSIESNQEVLDSEIWILDDEDTFLDMMQFGLENYEFTNVKIFSRGHDLLNSLDKEKTPDLILSDIHMPPPGGLKVLEKVKNTFGDKVKTIAVTGKLTDGLLDELSLLKVDKTMAKPFLVSTLKDEIYKLFLDKL
ncbi:MAG: response regulator [Candidatus Cloacimonetes bacterium]|nr:response regulator [Candidatus Cloacimonadota bacterium]